ncbi:MAG: right-handed parallel beta-helix repeat-containing protein [Fimbriimonadaceae bacterium]|nr:right-handed parallel beta-helix repeat-containing protein [Fimbriimonadaceae bacterium]
MLLLTCLTLLADAPADFYVAPAGRDAWSGTLPAPNAAGTDGPFATPARAQQAVRALRAAAPQRATPVTVLLRGGVYELAAPLLLDPRDGGSAASPTVWAAYPGEQPVLSGGTRLRGWRVEGGRWKLQLPAGQRFAQLTVNGQRRYRPRFPKGRYLTVAKELPPTPANEGQGWDRLGFAKGQLDPALAAPDVEVVAFHEWTCTRIPLKSITEGVLTLTRPTGTPYWIGLQQGRRFLLDNVGAALSEPGEWYLSPTGELTYLPLPGEDPATTEVVAPRLTELLQVRGDAAAGLPVAHLALRGLTLAHTNYVLPPDGRSFPQAEADLPAALNARALVDSQIEDCTFEHLAGWGLDLAGGCQRDTIRGCTFADLGAGGLKIGLMGAAPTAVEQCGWHTITQNTLAHGGRLHPAGIGVWIGHSPYNEITQNDIYDFYYTGISVGWTWGYGVSQAHHNTIADNHVWLIGQGVLSDMGGIYTLGLHDGTEIRHNLFHDIDAYTYGGWGIYFDEGTSRILAEDNLVYRTKTGGFHQHYGRDNVVRNNIFAYAKVQQLQRTRSEEHRSFTFEQNIVLWNEGPLLGSNWRDPEHFVLRRNLYWHTAGTPFDFAGHTLPAWQAKGQDLESVVADPLFVGPEQGDYSLQPGSPAARIGFRPFPLTGWGRTTPGGEAARRAVPAAWPPPTAVEVSKVALDEDFELVAVGGKCPGGQTNEDAKVTTATCRVTAETAASGQHSLKFSDQPGQQNPWDPHLVFNPGYRDGVLEASFDLRLLPGAVFQHEWRDWTVTPYLVGPSLQVKDGQLTANGRALRAVPSGVWLHCELVCPWGAGQPGTWTLRLSLPGEPAQEWPDLPCDKRCRTLSFFGFIAHAETATGFYLDNLKLRQR